MSVCVWKIDNGVPGLFSLFSLTHTPQRLDFMVRKDGAEIRRARIQEIASLVLKNLHKENPLSLSQTLAALQYQFGLTKEKILEYLNIMQEMGQFIIENENDQIKKATDSQ